MEQQKFVIQWVDECDSTSRQLKEQVKSGFRQPIALAATRQTAGTGRMGRAWQSLEGNLHLSLALPASRVSEDLRDILPLAAGVILHRWFQKYVGVSPCLKWPNDVLLDGRKIAGILCEGSIQGGEFLGVVIGIGVNLVAAPDLSSENAVSAGHLAALTGIRKSASDAVDEIVGLFESDWPKLRRAQVLEDWASRAIHPGHLWVCDKTREFFSDGGIDEAGGLRLTPIGKAGDAREDSGMVVSSANNDFSWSQLKTRRFLVADVGNSRVKIGVVSIQQVDDDTDRPRVDDMALDDASGQAILEFARRQVASGCPPLVHAVSVNPDGLSRLRSLLAPFNILVRPVQRRPVRVTRSDYDLDSIGADRLAQLEASLYSRHVGEVRLPILCVSLGTATTVDAVDKTGRHLGGYILTGLRSGLDAASARGALLPKSLEVKSGVAGKWPTSTNDAMAMAGFEATLAFLRSEVRRLADFCQTDESAVSVILTGGFAEAIALSWVSPSVRVDSRLTLLGAAILALNGR